MSRRHVENLTDLLIVAVSPALIMFLVGSLVFFLTHLVYDGDFPGRLRFASGLFVMAAVLIARISIEEGREYASFFALPLCVVTVLSMLKYTDAGLVMILPLVGFVWWSTDKLTWDCTVLNDREDTSGQGLLHTLQSDENETWDDAATTEEATTKPSSLWERWVARRRRYHKPGVWVIYFGLGGIILFGGGQYFIEPSVRPVGFLLLCIFVASTLALLMTTSFLQMRRYLMQRRLPFTDQMASIWLGSGGLLIVGLMLLALALPRPHTGYSVLESFERVATRENQRASRMALGKEGIVDEDATGRGDSERQRAETESSTGRQRDEQAEPSAPGDDGEPQGSGGSEGEQASAQSQDPQQDAGDTPPERSSDHRSTPQDAENKASDGGEAQDGSQRAEEDANHASDTQRSEQLAPPRLPELSFGNFAKWIYWAVMAGVVLFVLVRYGREIGAALQALMAELRGLLARLFGGRSSSPESDEEDALEAEDPLRPFADYPDPFLMGTEQQFSAQELVRYTFEAVQAWARENASARGETQTALEFTSQLARHHEHLAVPLQHLSALYNQAAYAPGTLRPESRQHLKSVWKALRSRPPATTAAS